MKKVCVLSLFLVLSYNIFSQSSTESYLRRIPEIPYPNCGLTEKIRQDWHDNINNLMNEIQANYENSLSLSQNEMQMQIMNNPNQAIANAATSKSPEEIKKMTEDLQKQSAEIQLFNENMGKLEKKYYDLEEQSKKDYENVLSARKEYNILIETNNPDKEKIKKYKLNKLDAERNFCNTYSNKYRSLLEESFKFITTEAIPFSQNQVKNSYASAGIKSTNYDYAGLQQINNYLKWLIDAYKYDVVENM